MKALVVYESMWGNTERVAEAVASGLREAMEVDLVEASTAPSEPGPAVALIDAGGPTHAFSMSRASTRAEAVSRGADHPASELGLREWLDRLPPGPHSPPIAPLATPGHNVRHLPRPAATAPAQARPPP